MSETPSTSGLFVENKIDDLRASQENSFETLTKAITTLINQNNEIKNSVDCMSAKYDSLLSKVETLEQENHRYRSQVQSLEDRLELLERQNKSTSVEVRNIPKAELENRSQLTGVVKNIIASVGASPPLQDLEVREIYRSKSGAVIVDFTTTVRKSNLVSKYKEYNKANRSRGEPQLNTQSLNIPGVSKPVFISDRLTAKTGHLYYQAREQVKIKNFAAAWTSHGIVYIKLREGEHPIKITREDDLLKLLL